MKTQLHVGNLSSRATEKNLRFLFAQKGRVRDIELIVERATGRSRAFAIVTMASVEGAEAALLGLHRSIWNGRHITVHEMPAAELEPPRLSWFARSNYSVLPNSSEGWREPGFAVSDCATQFDRLEL